MRLKTSHQLASFWSNRKLEVKWSEHGKRLESVAGSVKLGIILGFPKKRTVCSLNNWPTNCHHWGCTFVLFADDTTALLKSVNNLSEWVAAEYQQIQRVLFAGRSVTAPTRTYLLRDKQYNADTIRVQLHRVYSGLEFELEVPCRPIVK